MVEVSKNESVNAITTDKDKDLSELIKKYSGMEEIPNVSLDLLEEYGRSMYCGTSISVPGDMKTKFILVGAKAIGEIREFGKSFDEDVQKFLYYGNFGNIRSMATFRASKHKERDHFTKLVMCFFRQDVIQGFYSKRYTIDSPTLDDDLDKVVKNFFKNILGVPYTNHWSEIFDACDRIMYLYGYNAKGDNGECKELTSILQKSYEHLANYICRQKRIQLNKESPKQRKRLWNAIKKRISDWTDDWRQKDELEDISNTRWNVLESHDFQEYREKAKSRLKRAYSEDGGIEKKLRATRKAFTGVKTREHYYGEIPLTEDIVLNCFGENAEGKPKTKDDLTDEELALYYYTLSLSYASHSYDSIREHRNYYDNAIQTTSNAPFAGGSECIKLYSRNDNGEYNNIISAIIYRLKFEEIRRKDSFPEISLFDEKENDRLPITFTSNTGFEEALSITMAYYFFISERFVGQFQPEIIPEIMWIIPQDILNSFEPNEKELTSESLQKIWLRMRRSSNPEGGR